MNNPMEIAYKAYNGNPPPYVVLLVKELVKPKMRQKDVGEKIGYSRSAVSLLIHNKYNYPHEDIKEAILKNLAYVECSIFQKMINIEKCEQQQKKPFSAINPKLKKDWLVCNACPHNQRRRSDVL